MTVFKQHRRRMARLLAAVSTVALLSACAATPTPFTPEEFAARAKADRAAMFKDQKPITKPLTLADSVARVLSYNLDKRSKMMEEALALGQLDLDRFDLLPKLAANAGYSERSSPNATQSRDLYTQTTSTSNPSYSADRFSITSDLGLTWNILDFGVSYFTAHQNADRALIAAERRRKTVANLVQEVRFTFWRAAAAQVLKGKVEETVASAEVALKDSERVENERLRNPTESLRVQKTLLESIRQLEAINQELTTAKAELAALINVPPGSDFKLAVPEADGMAIPTWSMSIEQMEEVALSNNPDLREQDYQGRIAIDDTYKEILKLFPGITLSLSRQYDSNSFLIDNHWNEVGTKISWNLMNLLSGPDRISHAESAEDVAEAKRVALRMAVLAQVHVVSTQFASAAKQYERADKLWKIEQRLAEASGNQSRGGTQNEIERISTETSAIAAELRRFQSYAQMQSAYGKMQSTIGADPIPERIATHSLDGLSGAIMVALGETPVPEARVQAVPKSPTEVAPPAPAETVAAVFPQATQLQLASVRSTDAGRSKWRRMVRRVPALRGMAPVMVPEGSAIGMRVEGDAEKLTGICALLRAAGYACQVRRIEAPVADADGGRPVVTAGLPVEVVAHDMALIPAVVATEAPEPGPLARLGRFVADGFKDNPQ